MSGPRYCIQCGTWPGIYGPANNLCHICGDIRHCQQHPVPLPRNAQIKSDIVRLFQSTGTPILPSYEEVY